MNGSWLSANAIRTIYCTLDDVFRHSRSVFQTERAKQLMNGNWLSANAMRTIYCTLDDVFRHSRSVFQNRASGSNFMNGNWLSAQRNAY